MKRKLHRSKAALVGGTLLAASSMSLSAERFGAAAESMETASDRLDDSRSEQQTTRRDLLTGFAQAGGANEAEIAADLFILWGDRGQLENTVQDERFIGVCSKNLRRSWARREARYLLSERPDEQLAQNPADVAGDAITPERLLIERHEVQDRQGSVQGVLEQLSAQDRGLLEQRLTGLSFEEISKETGVSSAAIRKRFSRKIYPMLRAAVAS